MGTSTRGTHYVLIGDPARDGGVLVLQYVRRNGSDFGLLCEVERSIQEQIQVQHVSLVLRGDERVRRSVAASSRAASDSVHEQFRFSGEVNVHHVVQARDINSSGGDVRDDEHRDLIQPEPRRVDLTRRGVHARVNHCVRDVCLVEHLRIEMR